MVNKVYKLKKILYKMSTTKLLACSLEFLVDNLVFHKNMKLLRAYMLEGSDSYNIFPQVF